jgi:broad specificity phosphatase PhoE
MRTAESIARPLGLDVKVHSGLLDINFGLWQGLTVPEVRARWPELCEAWHTRPDTVHVPGGETLADVSARGLDAVQEICAAHADQTVILVGHNVVNRVMVLGILGLGNAGFWRIAQDPCCINVFEFSAGAFTLISMNDTGHLVR